MRLINRQPDAVTRLLLPALPFVAVVTVYAVASAARLADNPDDKLLPGWSSLLGAIQRVALSADRHTGDILLWTDTAASLQRLVTGLLLSAGCAFVVGVAVGMVPYLRMLLGRFIDVVSMVPPLAVLPILFISLGLGETSKVALIMIGTAPLLIRDLIARVQELPREQMIKAQTLGASSWQIASRVVIPQILPRLIDGVRLSLGPAWLFLISAEAIASEDGLGYRIFLVRRYFAMDVILPYVAWITLLAFALDIALSQFRRVAFPWFLPRG